MRRAAGCNVVSAIYGYSVGLGRYEDALGLLQKAVSLQPESPDAQYSLVQALLRLGHKEEAQAAFKRVDAIHATKHSTAKRALGTSGTVP